MDKIDKATTSSRSGPPKSEARHRLADLLRANLGRRKIQERERKRNQGTSMAAAPAAGTGSAETPISPGVAPEDEAPVAQI